ncbi:hypothetical protein NCLIV_032610 [Neospora caninum Liverpool]|uniref:ELM2 domain-containing protein n=1 Tax=Neospora caninum (strain Liverpool) TaxID=572307 RepID=F0VIB3_NEOCL|nr:hypothetical protein NCLIV_032610 [Neospora caninum Liverpool]CBZ53474.1 hypothetical protein NCLIV_032610 [Neospora caninum Liverpool]CEL67461.1 TPA: hypothetical protein BN1204_032610 [Neospora caninum Liverpool]|eukprot:XP_003883506.1 hypothetical protein NCLIV_032610 [Neospora caninum Liverpool]
MNRSSDPHCAVPAMETSDRLFRETGKEGETEHQSAVEDSSLVVSTPSRARCHADKAGEALDPAVALDSGTGRPHVGLADTAQETCAQENSGRASSPEIAKAGLEEIPQLPATCRSGASAASATSGIMEQQRDEQPDGLASEHVVKGEEPQSSKGSESSLLSARRREREGVRSLAGKADSYRERGSSPLPADDLCVLRSEGTVCYPDKETERRSGECLRSETDAAPAFSEPGRSQCARCGGGGQLRCCVSCVRSFHSTCLEQSLPSSNGLTFRTSQWTCPACQAINRDDPGQQQQSESGRAGREGILERGDGDSDAVGNLAEGEEPSGGKGSCGDSADADDAQEATPAADKEPLQDSKGASLPDEIMCGGVCHTGEKKEYMATKKRHAGVAVSPKATASHASPRSASPSPSHYSRKRRRCEGEAGGTSRCKVNIGPRHQVPAVPPFFLDSTCAWDGKAETLSDFQGLYANDTDDTARLVYSPYAMQRVYMKRLAEGAGDKIIKNAEEMNSFIQRVAQNWTSKSGWQPFSPEYAYKLLHFAGYDPHRAIRIMKDPNFCFTAICDPPQRRYDNKWRPNDRRGQIGTHPYPCPLTLRAYLSKRNQHAAAAFHRGAPR